MAGITVGPPPPDGRYGAKDEKWIEVVRIVNEKPGTWALAGEFSPGIAGQIRNGDYPAFIPEGYDGDTKAYMEAHYEITTRKAPNADGRRRSALYVRRLPDA
jgi:hypothetical protein